jgi:hypothetical protein
LEIVEAYSGAKAEFRSNFQYGRNGFCPEEQVKKVLTVGGSRNVLTKSVEASFHMTVVAACATNGFVAPSLYIVPGQGLNRDVLDAPS